VSFEEEKHTWHQIVITVTKKKKEKRTQYQNIQGNGGQRINFQC